MSTVNFGGTTTIEYELGGLDEIVTPGIGFTTWENALGPSLSADSSC